MPSAGTYISTFKLPNYELASCFVSIECVVKNLDMMLARFRGKVFILLFEQYLETFIECKLGYRQEKGHVYMFEN